MMKKYTREEIMKQCQTALEKGVSTFYTSKVVNYQGMVADEETYYTEVVAEYVLANIDMFKSIEPISRHKKRKSYKLNHTGKHKQVTTRTEEVIAMDMFCQAQKGYIQNHIGKIIDYQTPLKAAEKDAVGKTDMLSETDDAVYILELKRKASTETLLRCVLECYTYLRVIPKDELFEDFGISMDKNLYAAPLVFVQSRQWKEMQKKEKHPKLIKLMEKLGVKGPFYVESEKVYGVIE